MSRHVKTHKHTYTFSGELPADEADRMEMYANHPAINEHRKGLADALEAAGHPHTVVSHIVRPRVVKAAASE
jgi:hypothetical protein